ncbi:MAG: NADAR family protein [Candidatus Omnitrophica bacterium]|nr:NADAR family protein [Candidatus Omnitrophota bacterium]
MIGIKILAFARYTSPSLKNAPKINIWYPRMGDWCRTCFAEGHRASSCPKKMEKLADEFKDLTEWKGLMKKLTTDYEDQIEPFFTKESPFSNHHLCEVKVEEVTYKSTEHCLFAQWALYCKDTEAAEEIKKADTSAKAMKHGQKRNANINKS